MGLHILAFVFLEGSFLNPSDHFPTFELDYHISSIDWLREIDIDVTFDGVTCEVERLIELNEG